VTREQLEHVIRAAATIADDDEIVVVGSRPEPADLIDGSIGEGSMFHEAFGYYAKGVAPTTAVLADGWEQRAVPVKGPGTRGATGCPLDDALRGVVRGRVDEVFS
jgi:hypothetical protein